jgi:outer membrane receptor protein involved in Fe transport
MRSRIQTTFVDLNSVLIGAVERVEILKDGASAIYGSEAMAGVVTSSCVTTIRAQQ